MKSIYLSVILCFALLHSKAQQQFQAYFGDSASPLSFTLWDINPAADTGFVFSGNYYNGSAIILKSGRNGNVQWYKKYSALYDIYSVKQTADGGFIAAGATTNSRFVVMKTDAAGDVEWTRMRATTTMCYPGGNVFEVPGGGYLVTGGCTGLDTVFVSRLDTAGTVLWERTLGVFVDGYNHRYADMTADHGMIICGTLAAAGGTSLVKLDSMGNVQWQKSFDPGTHGFSVYATGNHYFLSSFGGNHSMIYTDSAGNPVWARQWPVNYISNVSEYPFSVAKSGHRLIAYGKRFVGSQTTSLLMEFDATGNVQWDGVYSTTSTNNVSDGMDVLVTADNELVFIAPQNTLLYTWLVKMPSNGLAACNYSLPSFGPTSYAVITGTTTMATHPYSVAWNSIANTTSVRTPFLNYTCGPLAVPEPAGSASAHAFPDPAGDWLTIEGVAAERITVTDISGRVLKEIEVAPGSAKVELNVSDFAAGIYFWSAGSAGRSSSGKFCVQH